MRISDWSSDVCSSDLLHNRWKTLLLGGGGAFAATIMAFMTLPFQFQPTIDTDYSQVNVEMVPGSTLEQTGAVTQHVADVLSQSSIVDSAFSDIEPTKATIYLTLKKGHEQSSVDWEREMAPKRSEEHTSELQSLMRTSYAVFCLKKKKQ